MTETQASRLLSVLFEYVDGETPLMVLNIGPALPETVNFFADYRCKLYFADLYAELPLRVTEEDAAAGIDLSTRLENALDLPAGVRFDIIFFWDVLNFMSRDTVGILAEKLRPHLHQGSRAHGFAVHSSRTPVAEHSHGIVDEEHFSLRKRPQAPPDYQPHPHGEVASILRIFQVDRSVLLPDRRIELLLKATL